MFYLFPLNFLKLQNILLALKPTAAASTHTSLAAHEG